jgi:hypothetical protein
MHVRVAVPSILFVSVLAGCIAQEPFEGMEDAGPTTWALDIPLDGGHGVLEIRLPFEFRSVDTSEALLRYQIDVQLDGAGSYYPANYYYSVFMENESGDRTVFLQNLIGGGYVITPATAAVHAQGQAISDNRGAAQGAPKLGGSGRLIQPGDTLVMVLAFDDGATTKPIALAHLRAEIFNSTQASFGMPQIHRSDRAGNFALHAPGAPVAHACAMAFVAHACALKLSGEFTAVNQTLIAWLLRPGAGGHGSIRVAGQSLVADCQGQGADILWQQAVLREPGTWTVDVELVGAGSIFTWPLFYLFWADAPAILREGVDDPGC